jgi:carbon monoxide dehydrogenase subunit G
MELPLRWSHDPEADLEINNSFKVPVPIAEAWKVLIDIERIVPCMPGAQLLEVIDASNYRGQVSTRLGPVTMTFGGTASIEELDAANHRARIKTQGRDSKGRGGVEASISFSLAPEGSVTAVSVHTDLRLSGSVAQYGRGAGMVTDLASHWMAQFAECLQARLVKGGGQDELAGHTHEQKSVPLLGLGLRLLWNAVRRAAGRLLGRS